MSVKRSEETPAQDPQPLVGMHPPVLCVDVDGTLLKTDLLFESLRTAIKGRLSLAALLPFWLLRGRAYLKRKLAQTATLQNSEIPFNPDLVAWLTKENENGRRIVLCSASDEALVSQVAARLGFPVEVMASDGAVNLKGRRKAQALVDRFGARGFDYAGNSRADLPVWRQARQAIVVNASSSVERSAQSQGNVGLVVKSSGGGLRSIVRAMRLYQWVKNILVFLPLITSHKFTEPGLVMNAVITFFSLSLCASSIYVINDISDLDSDRRHHSKRNRPIASGALSIPAGLLLACASLCGGILLSLFLNPISTLVVLTYTAISFAYTFWLKQKLLADVLTLAILYAMRIIAGGTATSIPLSTWLVAFSLFFFLSLAFSKRVAEMIRVGASSRDGLVGRGYLVMDTQIVGSLGATSGYLACLVMSLYINSDAVHKLYAHPDWLWLLLPLLLYMIGRLWVLTMRGRMTDDPILFVLRDAATYWVLVAGVLVFLAATKLPFGVPGLGE